MSQSERRRRYLVSAHGWRLRQPWETLTNCRVNAESVGDVLRRRLANTFGVGPAVLLDPRVEATPGLKLVNAFGVQVRTPPEERPL